MVQMWKLTGHYMHLSGRLVMVMSISIHFAVVGMVAYKTPLLEKVNVCCTLWADLIISLYAKYVPDVAALYQKSYSNL